MSDKTGIEWTDSTWSPVTGCQVVSAGCANCYAQQLAATRLRNHPRYKGLAVMKSNGPHWTGEVRFHADQLAVPLRWLRPRRIFVANQSDLFHEGLADEEIDRVFAVMVLARHHTFQILTKRPERMRDYLSGVTFERLRAWMNRCADGGEHRHGHPNLTSIVHGTRGPSISRSQVTFPQHHIWLGVSVEDQATADDRIPLLLETPAAVRFISYEPALGPVDFNDPMIDRPSYFYRYENVNGPRDIHWVIVGGESGPGARPFDVAWARSAVAQCRAAGVACFIKQLGAFPVKAAEPGERVGTTWTWKARKGGDPAEWPEDLRVRQFPNEVRPCSQP